MALTLQLSYCQSNGCKTLTITDSTGTYDVTTNPTGCDPLWLPDVTAATLVITDPSDNEYTIDIISDLGIDYSTATVDTLEYDVPSTLLGKSSTEAFDDGIYEVVYTITLLGVTTFTVTRMFAVDCSLRCDIDSLLAMVPSQYNCNSCNTDFIDDVFLAYMLFKAMQNAAQCGGIDEWYNMKTTLTKLITNIQYGL